MNVGIMHIRAAEVTHDLFEICADRSYLTFLFMLEAEVHQEQRGTLSIHGQIREPGIKWPFIGYLFTFTPGEGCKFNSGVSLTDAECT